MTNYVAALILLVVVGGLPLLAVVGSLRAHRITRRRRPWYLEQGDWGLEDRALGATPVRLATVRGDEWIAIEGCVREREPHKVCVAPLSCARILWGRIAVFEPRGTRNALWWKRLGEVTFGASFDFEDAEGDRVQIEPVGVHLFPQVQHKVGPVPLDGLPVDVREALARATFDVSRARKLLIVEEVIAAGEEARIYTKVTGAAAAGSAPGYRGSAAPLVLRGDDDRPLAILTRRDALTHSGSRWLT